MSETYDRGTILKRGVGGPRSGRPRRRSRRSARREHAQPRHDPQPRRLLDAEAGDGEDHLRLPGDAAGPGRQLQPVVRRLDEPGEGRRSPGSRPTSSSSRPATTSTCSSTPGLVNANWDHQGYSGIAADTVVVFALRDGNPKKIKGWDDLIKPGVQVVTPNPFSSGSAKWNILAAYGAQRHLGKTDAQAIAYVQKLFKNVVSQDTSGANATNTFLSGKGDVLITYESEAINARLQGKNIQYVIPRQTMLIELPIAVLAGKPEQGPREQVHPVRQVEPGAGGLRAVRLPPGRTSRRRRRFAKQFPVRPGQFTINDKTIGGWRAADKKWFDPSNGLMVKIEQAVGGPTLPSARQSRARRARGASTRAS